VHFGGIVFWQLFCRIPSAISRALLSHYPRHTLVFVTSSHAARPFITDDVRIVDPQRVSWKRGCVATREVPKY
jgi:hypothetical protein